MTPPQYHPAGTLSQLPAIRPGYQGKNVRGGRRIPPSYLGAGVKDITKAPYMQGLDDVGDVSVRLTIGAARLSMCWNDLTEGTRQ